MGVRVIWASICSFSLSDKIVLFVPWDFFIYIGPSQCYELLRFNSSLSLSFSFFFYYISILEDKIQVLKFSRKNVWIKLLSQYCYLSLLYSKIQNTRNNLTTNKT